jgi:DNA-binding LacI/PurR family transcriptional regulator
VDQHPELIGSTTMQLNVERLDGKPVEPGIRWIKTELIARESCGAGLPQAAVEDGGER